MVTCKNQLIKKVSAKVKRQKVVNAFPETNKKFTRFHMNVQRICIIVLNLGIYRLHDNPNPGGITINICIFM